MVIGSETCSLQFDFSLFISFLIYFVFRKAGNTGLSQPLRSAKGKGLASILRLLRKKRERVSLERVSESWRPLGRRWGSEAKVRSHRAIPTCPGVISQEGSSASLSKLC